MNHPDEYPTWLKYEEDDVAGVEVWRCQECGAEVTRELGTLAPFDEDAIPHEFYCRDVTRKHLRCQCPDHPGHKDAYEECHRCGKPLCGDCTLSNFNIDTGKYVFDGSVCVTCHDEVQAILRSRGIEPVYDWDELEEEATV